MLVCVFLMVYRFMLVSRLLMVQAGVPAHAILFKVWLTNWALESIVDELGFLFSV